MGVGVQGDRYVGVAEAFADHLGGDPGGQGGAGVGVAEIVEPDAGQTGFQATLLEPGGEAVGMDGRAIFLAKDEPLVALQLSGNFSLCPLRLAVGFEGRHGGRVQRH